MVWNFHGTGALLTTMCLPYHTIRDKSLARGNLAAGSYATENSFR